MAPCTSLESFPVPTAPLRMAALATASWEMLPVLTTLSLAAMVP